MGERAGARKRARGEGRLYKRGATWWGRLRIAGAERNQSLRTGDRAEAARRLKAWAREEATWRPAAGADRRTWIEAVERWNREIVPGLRAGAAERYRTSLRQLDPWLRHRFVDELGRAAIVEIVGQRRAAGGHRGGQPPRSDPARRPQISNATINRDLTALSSVLGACMAWGWASENGAAAFDRKRLSRERRDPITIPADADVDRLLARAPGGFGALLAFLAETGMRQEEAAGLAWSDVSIDCATVTLTRTKTGRPRTLALRPEAAAILRRQVRHLRVPWVFWHETAPPAGAPPGTPPGAARYTTVPTRFRVVSRALAKATAAATPDQPFRPFRCHDLRHRFAVQRLAEGWDIYDLARYMGHSTVKTTEIYLGYVPGGTPIARTGPATPPGKPPADKGTIRGTAASKKPQRRTGNARK